MKQLATVIIFFHIPLTFLKMDSYVCVVYNIYNGKMCSPVLLQDAQIDALFQKIDWSSEGAITWDEFCTYMQLEYAEKEDSYLRAKEVAFHLPAKIHNMPHREPILRITDMDGTFMACSQDGLVTFWSSNTDLKRSKQVQVGFPEITCP